MKRLGKNEKDKPASLNDIKKLFLQNGIIQEYKSSFRIPYKAQFG